MAYSMGLDQIDDGRSVAPLDFDGDGDLDLAMLNLRGLRLMENTSPPRRFARVRLVSSPLGAIVEIETSAGVQRDYVKATTGFATQVPLDLHFGLNDAERIDRLTIFWPDGVEQTLTNLPVDLLLTIREGDDEVTATPLPRWPEASRPRGITGPPADLTAERVEGGRAPLLAEGRPSVLHFPAAGQESGLSKLEPLSRRARVVAVYVDASSAPDVSVPGFVADAALIESIFGATGPPPLPVTLVLDTDGRLRRAFIRDVSRDEVEEILESLGAGPWASDYASLGQLHLHRKEFDTAAEYFERAIQADAEAGDSHYMLGVVRVKQKRLPEAIREFRKQIDVDPEYVWAHVDLGIVFFSTRRLEESERELREAIRLDPDLAKARVCLATLLAEGDKLSEASEQLEAALRLDSDAWELHNALAGVYVRMGKIEKARTVFQRSLDLNPDNEMARRFLERVRRNR